MTTMISRHWLVAIFLVVFAPGAWAAPLTVNSLADTVSEDGLCTLREAITSANTDTASGALAGECDAGSGDDLITFSVAGSIKPDSQLPTIITVIHINGYSAPGASVNTLPLSQGTNAVLTVEIDGVNAGNVKGLELQGADAAGSIIEGLAINNSGNETCCAQDGIFLDGVQGASTTYIRGNFVGLDLTGTTRAGKGSRGVSAWNSSGNIVIGSDTGGVVDPAAVNVISGNGGASIYLTGTTNVRIRGNLVGTTATGAAAVTSYQDGIGADATTDSWITDNLVSGLNGVGITIRATSSGIHIERNLVGVTADGMGALPNKNGGINISENSNSFPTSILNLDIVDNIVANNTCNGCSGGIRIGENNSANTVEGIRLRRNLVHDNLGLEIDLGETNGTDNGLIYGVTPNDAGDPDTGVNTFQNFPVLNLAAAGGVSVTINYSLNSEASKEFTLEFFYTATCDNSGYGGAEQFLGDVVVNTNGSGDTGGQVQFPLAAETGFITATATNTGNGTSEFSECIALSSDTEFEDGFENSNP